MLDGVTGDVGDDENGGGVESGEEEEMSGGPQQLHADAQDDDDYDDDVAASVFKLKTNPALTKAPLLTPASSQHHPELTNPSSELTSLGKGQQLALASSGLHVDACLCSLYSRDGHLEFKTAETDCN